MNTHISQDNKKEKEGFVILVAVLVATVVVALGAFIAAIAVKELELSTSGRESQDAFYAADAALECALYQDFRGRRSPTDPNPIFNGTPAQITCNNAPITTVVRDVDIGTPQQKPSDASNSVTYFQVTFAHPDISDINLSPYALVKVAKTDIGGLDDKTVIEAQGYNVRDASVPGRVQRALQVVY